MQKHAEITPSTIVSRSNRDQTISSSAMSNASRYSAAKMNSFRHAIRPTSGLVRYGLNTCSTARTRYSLMKTVNGGDGEVTIGPRLCFQTHHAHNVTKNSASLMK